MHRVIRPIKYACVALDGHLVDISLPFIALCITKFRRHGYLMNQNREHGFQQWRKINGCEEEWVGQEVSSQLVLAQECDVVAV